MIFLFKHCVKCSSATLKKVNLAQCHSGAFSNLNWKSNLIHACNVIRVQNTFISVSPIHAQAHNRAEYFVQLFTRYPSTRLLGRRMVRLPFHPVAADGPGTDNARWQVDGIINNDFHPFWLSGRAASHNAPRRQAKHGHMLTHTQRVIYDPFLPFQNAGVQPKKRGLRTMVEPHSGIKTQMQKQLRCTLKLLPFAILAYSLCVIVPS